MSDLSVQSLISDLSVLSVPCSGYPVCLVCLMCPGYPVRLVCPVCPSCPVCPDDDHDVYSNHDDRLNHDDFGDYDQHGEPDDHNHDNHDDHLYHLHHLDHDEHLEDDDHLDHDELKFVRKLEVVHKEVGGYLTKVDQTVSQSLTQSVPYVGIELLWQLKSSRYQNTGCRSKQVDLSSHPEACGLPCGDVA